VEPLTGEKLASMFEHYLDEKWGYVLGANGGQIPLTYTSKIGVVTGYKYI
jgi:hypothetical protein